MARDWDKDLHYWDIKAKLGMHMIPEAKAAFFANREKFRIFNYWNLTCLREFYCWRKNGMILVQLHVILCARKRPSKKKNV